VAKVTKKSVPPFQLAWSVDHSLAVEYTLDAANLLNKALWFNGDAELVCAIDDLKKALRHVAEARRVYRKNGGRRTHGSAQPGRS
jgi:hypothetical protein